MPLFDMPLDEMRGYRPEVAEPADFDAFWQATLAEARQVDVGLELTGLQTPLALLDVFDVTFRGFGGHPVKGWLTRPKGAQGPLPVVVEFIGYNGGRDLPHSRTGWAVAGFAHFVMDTRGQGSGWGTGGSTPDPVGSGPAHPGFMTRGIDDPAGYYYRRVYTDAVRAVDAVRTLDWIDPDRICVAGASQGGGITVAVAGLVEGLFAALPDVPFLSHFARALDITGSDPYAEIARYLACHRAEVATAYRTLSYFDGVNFAKRATAPALFSTALMDTICPPSTVFASFNHWQGEREIEVYHFNGHEGGAQAHQWHQFSWLQARIAGA